MAATREAFRALSGRVAGWVGSPWFFAANLALVAVWLASGPFFHWGDTWQLVMTTGLTVTTQLLVILVQATTNTQGHALQAKLDELIRAEAAARNELIGLEEASEEQIKARLDELHALADAGPRTDAGRGSAAGG